MSRKDLASKRFIRLPDNNVADCVLFLKKNQQVYLFGKVTLQRVIGSLSVEEHNIIDNDWHLLCTYCPNVITLKSSLNKPRIDWKKTPLSSTLKDVYSKQNKPHIEKYSGKLNDVCCIILLKSTSLLSCSAEDIFDINKILDDEEIGSQNKIICGKTCDLNFTVFSDVPSCLSPLITSSDWSATLASIKLRHKSEHPPVILVCGERGAGKSTFGRYLINKLLNTGKHVWHLDTDVGQSEFTPPGILSLNQIKKPVFGPPFSHLSTPQRACFFGDVSPKDNPNSYVFMINSLYDYYKDNHTDGRPLVINTHGWVKGMGFRILLELIRLFTPTDIIQLSSENDVSKNTLITLNNEIIKNGDGWEYWKDKEINSSEKSLIEYSPNFHQLSAFSYDSDVSQKSKLSSRDLRFLSLTSYFGSFERSLDNALNIGNVSHICPVYSQSISNIKIYNVCDQVSENELLCAINGSIVGLVKSKNEGNPSKVDDVNGSCLTNDYLFSEYVGLGIVRNINPEAGVLYICSPVPFHDISCVNALIKGRLETPDISADKKRKFDKVPYWTSEFTYNHRGSGRKKVRYNLLRQNRSPHSQESGG